MRDHEKLVRNRERLARLEPGGSSDLPLEVSSASLIDPRASAMPCPTCLGEVRVDEHVALVVGARRLRLARVVCRTCGCRRDVYFRIGTTLAS